MFRLGTSLAQPTGVPTLALKLRCGGPVQDPEFDRLYPDWARSLSTIHWTPVEVARRAAELLVVRAGMRILDVGAGVGKFCLVGALATPAVFYGIEQRLHFVQVAQQLAARVGARNAKFLHGNMMSIDWRGYDGFYLYNPFAENLRSLTEPVDRRFAAEPHLVGEYVEFVRMQLHCAPAGTRVVTFHGFGGDMPGGYTLQRCEPAHADELELWTKDEDGGATRPGVSASAGGVA